MYYHEILAQPLITDPEKLRNIKKKKKKVGWKTNGIENKTQEWNKRTNNFLLKPS